MRSFLPQALIGLLGIAAFAACGGSTSSTSTSSGGTSSGGTSSGGTSSGGTSSGGPVDAGTWTQVTPSGAVGEYASIWGSSSSNAWIVAEDGLLHFDGTSWTKDASASAATLYSTSFFSGISGTSATDIWIVGATPGPGTFAQAFSHYDGTSWSTPTDEGLGNGQLFRVFSISANDVYAVGKNESSPVAGIVLHYDGTSWKDVYDDAATELFAGIWASGPNDVWVSGDDGITHFDGTTWVKAVTASGGPVGIGNIFGTAHDDVWATGQDPNAYNSAVLHFDGTTWSVVRPANKGTSYGGIFGLSRGQVTVVGELDIDENTSTGLIVASDSSNWGTATLPAGTSPLGAIWGTADGGTWAIGDSVIMHRSN